MFMEKTATDANTMAWQSRLMLNGIGDLFGDNQTNASEQEATISKAALAALAAAGGEGGGKSNKLLDINDSTSAEKHKLLSQDQVASGIVGPTSSLDFLKAFSSNGGLISSKGLTCSGFGHFSEMIQPAQQQLHQIQQIQLPPSIKTEVSFPPKATKTAPNVKAKERCSQTNQQKENAASKKRKATDEGDDSPDEKPLQVFDSNGKKRNETAEEKQERVRQRNRIHARSCRIRKRQAMDELNAKVQALENENNTLKQAFRVLYNQKELTTAMVISEFGPKGVAVLEKLHRTMSTQQ
jgi:hypothetical protein